MNQVPPFHPSPLSSASNQPDPSTSGKTNVQLERHSYLPSKLRKKIHDQLLNLPISSHNKTTGNANPEKYCKSITQWTSYFQKALSSQATPREAIEHLTSERVCLINSGCKEESLYIKTIDALTAVYQRNISLNHVKENELLKIIAASSGGSQAASRKEKEQSKSRGPSNTKSGPKSQKAFANFEPLVKDLLKDNKKQKGLSGKQKVRIATDYCPNSRDLKVNLVGYPDVEDEDLKLLGRTCSELMSITIDGIGSKQNITDDGIHSLVVNSSNLKALNLFNFTKITDATLMTVAESCPRLIKITLASIEKITDLGLLILALRFPNLSTLKIINCPGITVQGIKVILSNLQNLRKITLIGEFHLSSYFLFSISKQFEQSLKKFKVHCHLDKNFLEAYVHFKAICPALEKIHMINKHKESYKPLSLTLNSLALSGFDEKASPSSNDHSNDHAPTLKRSISLPNLPRMP